MERDRIKVFDNLVETVMKDLQSALSSHRWISISEKKKGEDNGLADFFSNAVDTVIASSTRDIEVPSSSSSLTDSSSITTFSKEKCRAKKRGSSILNSLYEHGCKHGEAFMTDEKKKKRKERRVAEYTLAFNNFSIPTSQPEKQRNRQQKENTTKRSDILIRIEKNCSHSDDDKVINADNTNNNNNDKNSSISNSESRDDISKHSYKNNASLSIAGNVTICV